MFSAIKKIFSPPAYQNEAHNAYVTLVSQARKPVFYTQFAVADTLDGRFDVIILHMFMVTQFLRNKPSEEAALFSRALQEVFFADMDRSVREMGVSDTGVGKRIKKMAQAFYGRIQAYEESFSNTDKRAQSLIKNLYRGTAPGDEALSLLSTYIERNLVHLNTQDVSDITRGKLSFLD